MAAHQNMVTPNGVLEVNRLEQKSYLSLEQVNHAFLRKLFHSQNVNTQNGSIARAGFCYHSTNDLNALAFKKWNLYLLRNSPFTTEMFLKQD